MGARHPAARAAGGTGGWMGACRWWVTWWVWTASACFPTRLLLRLCSCCVCEGCPAISISCACPDIFHPCPRRRMWTPTKSSSSTRRLAPWTRCLQTVSQAGRQARPCGGWWQTRLCNGARLIHACRQPPATCMAGHDIAWLRRPSTVLSPTPTSCSSRAAARRQEQAGPVAAHQQRQLD